jgi:hypothetical protein
MLSDGQLKDEMVARLKQGSRMPGWTKREDFDWYQTIADREN